MKYVGSKNKISKYIIPIIQECIDKNNIETYYEPFVGGANMIDKIRCKNRIGNDIHKELIAMWKEIQNGWKIPLHISEDEYNKVRDNKSLYPPSYVGLVGFNATFGSKYFGGYARGFKADKITPRDIPNEALRNLSKQIPKIMEVKFLCSDYRYNKYTELKNAVVYCDPPYYGTTKYSTGNFDYNSFWEWCRKMSENNYVFVSEYNAPDDFECIWSKELTTTLDKASRNKAVEKLFRIKE